MDDNDMDETKYIDDIQRVAEKLGKPPTVSEYNEHGQWSRTTIRHHFGRWNIAVKEAGLETYPRTPSKEELKEDIERVGNKLGRQPVKNDMREYGEYSLSEIVNNFKSWKFALYEAGYEGALSIHRYLQENGPSAISDMPREPSLSDKQKGVTSFKFPDSKGAESVYYVFNEHSKEDVVRVAIQVNKNAIERQYEADRVGSTLGKTKGKEWADAYKNIKKDPNLSLDLTSYQQYSTEELVSELRQMYASEDITYLRIRNECSVSETTIIDRFGDIERINLIAAGEIELEDAELHE